MDGKGRILRTWMGGASYWDIARELTAVGLRCKHLGKVITDCPHHRLIVLIYLDLNSSGLPPTHLLHPPTCYLQPIVLIYVDNPATCRHVLHFCFPDLGKGFAAGDIGIKLDTNHFFGGMEDSMNSNHPSVRMALDELKERIHIIHDEDIGLPWEKQRKLRPPPHVRASLDVLSGIDGRN